MISFLYFEQSLYRAFAIVYVLHEIVNAGDEPLELLRQLAEEAMAELEEAFR